MRLFYLVGIVSLAMLTLPVPVSAGVIKYVDGSRYVGDVVNGYRRGEGIMYYADGDVLTASQWEMPMNVPGGFMRWDRKNGDVNYLHRTRMWYEVKYGDNKKLWFQNAMMYYRVLKVPVNGMLDMIGMVTEEGYGTAVAKDLMAVNYGPKSMQVAPNSCGMDTVWLNSRTSKTEPLPLLADCDEQGLPHGQGLFRSMDGLLSIEVNFDHGKPVGVAEMKLIKVSDYELLEQGRTRLESFIWAKGSPVLVMDERQKKIELTDLTVHTESNRFRTWSFIKGGTSNLKPFGKGYCYDDLFKVDSSGQPSRHPADGYVKNHMEHCEFSKSTAGYYGRIDDVYRERMRVWSAAYEARVQEDKESLRISEEENRREAERRAEDDRNDAARAARPVPYMPSAVAGAMKLQQIQREAERYGAGQREARAAQASQATAAPDRGVSSGGSGPSTRLAATSNAAPPPQVISAAPSSASTSGAKEPASDPNPYEFDLSWRQVGYASEPAREASCSKATSYANSEMKKDAAALNALITTASTPCVCAYSTVSGNYPQWRCAIYVQQKGTRKSGPSDGVSR
jgi:hypothetical protein